MADCKEAHKVGDLIPQITDLQCAGLTCNCGKFIYEAISCGCPGNPHDELRAKENPNYQG